MRQTPWNRSLLTLSLVILAAFAAAPGVEAQCTGFPGNQVVNPGAGFSSSATVSNLAYATYFVSVTQTGNFGLLNLSVTPLPGFTTGFTGTGTTLFIGFFVPPAAQPGQQAVATIRVFNTLGQTICQSSFTVTVAGLSGGNTSVEYEAHSSGLGWLGWVTNGMTAGTTGQGLQMEAAQIRLQGAPAGMGICYSAHVAVHGWLSTVCDGAVAGTTGQGLRMEAIRVSLIGAPAGCSVEYRAHVGDLGWLPWVSNNAAAGTVGQSRQMEALQVRLTGCP